MVPYIRYTSNLHVFTFDLYFFSLNDTLKGDILQGTLGVLDCKHVWWMSCINNSVLITF